MYIKGFEEIKYMAFIFEEKHQKIEKQKNMM